MKHGIVSETADSQDRLPELESCLHGCGLKPNKSSTAFISLPSNGDKTCPPRYLEIYT